MTPTDREFVLPEGPSVPGSVPGRNWIYREVGKVLVRRGSSDPRYQQWIATYGGNEFGAIVQEVLDVADRLGARLEPAERTRAGQHFHVTSRYSASQERYGGAASWLRSTSRT